MMKMRLCYTLQSMSQHTVSAILAETIFSKTVANRYSSVHFHKII